MAPLVVSIVEAVVGIAQLVTSWITRWPRGAKETPPVHGTFRTNARQLANRRFPETVYGNR